MRKGVIGLALCVTFLLVCSLLLMSRNYKPTDITVTTPTTNTILNVARQNSVTTACETKKPPVATSVAPAAVAAPLDKDAGWCTFKESGNTAFKTEKDYISKPSCEFDAEVKCDPLLPGHHKGKALVLMMIDSNTPLSDNPKATNVLHFLGRGYIPEGKSTELFDGVDFVFYRADSDVKVVTPVIKQDNVELLLVPPGFCDLSAHGQVLQYLGYQQGDAKVFPRYRSIVMMNPTVRGPFVGSKSSSWIDVVSMAGEQRRANSWEGEHTTRPFTTMAGSKAAYFPGMFPDRDVPLHLQSYFLVVPIQALSVVYRRFVVNYDAKWACVVRGETKTVVALLQDLPREQPWITRILGPEHPRAYAAGQRKFIERPDFRTFSELPDQGNADSILAAWQRIGDAGTDPCLTNFIKFGGYSWGAISPHQVAGFGALSKFTKRELKAFKRPPLSTVVRNMVEPNIGSLTNGKMFWATNITQALELNQRNQVVGDAFTQQLEANGLLERQRKLNARAAKIARREARMKSAQAANTTK